MVMVDATGTPIDVDSFCLALDTGLGGSDGDYGSFGTGYLPVSGPATYALFDLTAADLAALTGFGDADQEYFDYVVANCRLLAQAPFDVVGLVSGTPFSLSAGFQCYQVKDRTSPKPDSPSDVAVTDDFGTSLVDIKKPAYLCAPTGAGVGDPAICCYKAKGEKLDMPPTLPTLDDFGARSLEVKSPKLICKICSPDLVP
jgi:hypothetical protein